MRSEVKFSTFLKRTIEKDVELQILISLHFKVARSTIQRWMRGKSRPHPYIQQAVIQYILDWEV